MLAGDRHSFTSKQLLRQAALITATRLPCLGHRLALACSSIVVVYRASLFSLGAREVEPPRIVADEEGDDRRASDDVAAEVYRFRRTCEGLVRDRAAVKAWREFQYGLVSRIIAARRQFIVAQAPNLLSVTRGGDGDDAARQRAAGLFAHLADLHELLREVNLRIANHERERR